MKLLKKHTTSKGNKLEFYELKHESDLCIDLDGKKYYQSEYIVVIDNSCQMERLYQLGTTGILCWDDYDKPTSKKTYIRSFEQVIDAWVNEEVHF